MAQGMKEKYILKYHGNEVYIYDNACLITRNHLESIVSKRFNTSLSFYRVDKKLIRVMRSLGYSLNLNTRDTIIVINEFSLYTFPSPDWAKVIRAMNESTADELNLIIDEWVEEMELECAVGVMMWAEKVKLPPGIEREMFEYLI